MAFYIVLNSEEIKAKIPYAIISETMSRSIWNTGRRKRLMKEQFTESEIKATYRLHQIANRWHLYKGVDDKVSMTLNTYNLWLKLAAFCSQL